MNKRNIILTGISIAGIFVVAGATGWGTLKCHDIIQDRKMKTLDKIKKCAPYFVPAGIAMLGTGAAIGANSYLGYKELAALSGTAAYAFKNRKILGEKIREKLPEEDIKKLKEKFFKYEINNANLASVEQTGNGDLLCLEGYSGRWFRSSEEAVIKAEQDFNQYLRLNDYASYNDFYTLLNIEQTHFGWQFGYAMNPDFYPIYKDGTDVVEFQNTFLYDDAREEEVLVIDVYTYPMECWQEV